MGLVVSLFLALATTIIAYAWLGQGGAVAGLIFLAVLFVGAALRVLQPKV
jgi:putative effector of murein hydrolase LrgA (UPF0299 family)